MPLAFWVDPEIAKDPDTSGHPHHHRRYTFFRSLEDAERSGALAKAGPHVGPARAGTDPIEPPRPALGLIRRDFGIDAHTRRHGLRASADDTRTRMASTD